MAEINPNLLPVFYLIAIFLLPHSNTATKADQEAGLTQQASWEKSYDDDDGFLAFHASPAPTSDLSLPCYHNSPLMQPDVLDPIQKCDCSGSDDQPDLFPDQIGDYKLRNWPELVGKAASEAERVIRSEYPTIKIIPVREGEGMHQNLDPNRVFLRVNRYGVVFVKPSIG